MKNKLLLSTAIASVAFAGLASAETKVGGNLEQTFNALSHDTAQTSARSFGAEHNISLSASKDLDNGLTAKYGTVLESDDGGSADTHYLTVGTDNITVSFARDHGMNTSGSAVPYIADLPATAACTGLTCLGKNINDSDVHDNDHVSINAKVVGGSIALQYAPDVKYGASPNRPDDSDVTESENSAMGLIYKGSLGVEGLTILAGKYKSEGEGSEQDITDTTIGASYSMNGFTIAAEKSDFEETAAASDVDQVQYGITYAASDNLSVGIYQMESETPNNTSDKDEEIKMAQVGYNLGGLGISLSYAEIENVNGSANVDAEQLQIRTIQKF